MTQSWTDFNDVPTQGWDTKSETVPTNDIRAALLDRIDQVLSHLLPAGHHNQELFFTVRCDKT